MNIDLTPEKMKQSVAMLTAEEFIQLLKEAIPQNTQEKEPEVKYIRTRKGLAAVLGVSEITIIKWEEKGLIKPHTQVGRVLIYDLNQCRENLRKHKS